MATPSGWSTQQLAEFLAAVSSFDTEEAAALGAVERAAEALDADVAAIVCPGRIVAAVGYPADATPVAELEAVAHGTSTKLDVPGIGTCAATAVPLDHPAGASLVLATSEPGLSREDAGLLRGLARATSMTMRMLRLLDDERARQAELERLANEQIALRRVATLVARRVSSSELFTAVAAEMGSILNAEYTSVVRFEADGFMTVAGSWSSRSAGPLLPAASRWSLEGDSTSASVFRTGRPARTTGYEHAAGELAEGARESGLTSSVGSPIVVDGRVWGAVIAYSTRAEPLHESTEGRMVEFTELVATAIANAESQAELTRSRARLVAAADETRRRIERDLHDGTQQRLVSLGLQLREAEAAVPPELHELSTRLSRTVAGLTEVVEDLQEISRGIHPAILSKGGLTPALRALARRSLVPVSLDVRADGRFSETVEAAAYYVVSEALTNAAKHARASEVGVEVEMIDGVVQLSIHDDGVGGADPRQGSGLVGLKDRVESLGGSIAIESPAGGGTTLIAKLPVEDS